MPHRSQLKTKNRSTFVKGWNGRDNCFSLRRC